MHDLLRHYSALNKKTGVFFFSTKAPSFTHVEFYSWLWKNGKSPCRFLGPFLCTVQSSLLPSCTDSSIFSSLEFKTLSPVLMISTTIWGISSCAIVGMCFQAEIQGVVIAYLVFPFYEVSQSCPCYCPEPKDSFLIYFKLYRFSVTGLKSVTTYLLSLPILRFCVLFFLCLTHTKGLVWGCPKVSLYQVENALLCFFLSLTDLRPSVSENHFHK